MKKFILGTLTGAIFTSTIALAASYIAQDASFKVMVNGNEFTSSKAVVIDGSTYLPLRAIGDVLGVPVNWNDQLRQVEVGTTENVETNDVQMSDFTKCEILTTKEDKMYKENNNIPNLGYIIGIDPYQAVSAKDTSNDNTIAYFYDTSDYIINPLRAYESLLKNVGFMVSCDNDKLDAKFSNDVLNLDYYIMAVRETSGNTERIAVIFSKLAK